MFPNLTLTGLVGFAACQVLWVIESVALGSFTLGWLKGDVCDSTSDT